MEEEKHVKSRFKGSKNRLPINNKADLLKERRLQEVNKNMSEIFCRIFESSKTINEEGVVNSQLLKNIVFNLSNASSDFAGKNLMNIIEAYNNKKLFYNDAAIRCYKRGDMYTCKQEIIKLVVKKLEKVSDSFYKNWVDLCYFMFKISENKANLNELQNALSFSSLDYMLSTELDLILLNDLLNSEEEEIGGRLEKSSKPINTDIKIPSKYLHSPALSDDVASEFETIFNSFMERWYSTDEEIVRERSNPEKLIDCLDYDSKGRWLFFIELAKRKNYSDAELNIKVDGYLKEIVTLCGPSGVAIFSKILGTGEGYIAKIFDRIVLETFAYMSKVVNREVLDEKEATIKEAQDEIKSMKAQNRTLTKQAKSDESSIKSLESKIEVLQGEIDVLKNDSCRKEEADKLRNQITGLISQVNNLKEKNTKLTNDSNWKDTKISRLETQMKEYQSIEMDMMTLQNENNVILEQIKSIENLENEVNSDSEYERKLNAIKDEHILFIGGTGNMMSKFKDMFPNSDYIDISDSDSNFDIPKRFNYVVIYTRVVTHAHCERAESLVGKEKLISINIFNSRLVVEELYKNIIGQ